MLLSARKLLSVDSDQLWDLLTGTYTVQFDDSAVEILASDLILSTYTWTFHREDPTLPLLATMVITPHLNKGVFTKSTMRSTFNHVLWSTYWHYQEQTSPYVLVEKLMWANMHLYNAAVKHTAAHIASLDIQDYFDILYHPTFVALKEASAKRGNSIYSVTEAIHLATAAVYAGELKDVNGELLTIQRSCLAGIIKPPQAIQATFMRGAVPDIDRENLPYPITSCLVEGMNTPLEFAILSREGSVAEAASTKEISDVCYDGRRLSFVAQAKRIIEPGDCGSTHYLYWEVKPPIVQEGVTTQRGDLEILAGTYYMSDEGKLTLIKKTDTHLYGKTIKRRSSLTCVHPDHHVACSTCFGTLTSAIPPNVNAGITVSKKFSHDNAQNTLSIKHVLSSMQGEAAVLDTAARRFFTTVNNQYYLSTGCKDANSIILTLPRDTITNIEQLDVVDDVYGLVLSKISRFKEINIHAQWVRKSMEDTVRLSRGSVYCMLSYELLGYIKSNAEVISSNPESYAIDITHFPPDGALFTKPDVLASFSDTSKELATLFERTGSQGTDITVKDIMGTLDRLKEILLRMDATHISIIELILGAYLSVEGELNVRKGTNGLGELVHVSGDSAIGGRSLSSFMMYHSPVKAFLETPGTYLKASRDDSILDVFVNTHEVYQYHVSRGMTKL